jgi:hypothetical protein
VFLCDKNLLCLTHKALVFSVIILGPPQNPFSSSAEQSPVPTQLRHKLRSYIRLVLVNKSWQIVPGTYVSLELKVCGTVRIALPVSFSDDNGVIDAIELKIQPHQASRELARFGH